MSSRTRPAWRLIGSGLGFESLVWQTGVPRRAAASSRVTSASHASASAGCWVWGTSHTICTRRGACAVLSAACTW